MDSAAKLAPLVSQPGPPKSPWTIELGKFLWRDVTVTLQNGAKLTGNLRALDYHMLSAVLMTAETKIIVRNVSTIERARTQRRVKPLAEGASA